LHHWLAENINEINVFASRPGEDSFLTQFQNAEKNLAINRANSIKVPVGTQMVDTFANNNLPGQVATPVFNAAFNGASNGNGFANANFFTWLDQGQAGRFANSLAGAGTAGARYFCNLV